MVGLPSTKNLCSESTQRQEALFRRLGTDQPDEVPPPLLLDPSLDARFQQRRWSCSTGSRMQGRLGGRIGNRFGAQTMTTPIDRPSPVRILSALERQPGAWIRTSPLSIEHAGLRVRLMMGIVSVRIAYMVPDGDPVPIQAAPATRDRIAELLEDRLRRATGADLDPDDIAWAASPSPSEGPGCG
jgi:hypothetical protein